MRLIIILLLLIPTQLFGATLLTESFENTSFSARGWYDDSGIGAITSSGCYSGNCLQLTWDSTDQVPNNSGGGATIRNTFTATESLYVSVYWKFETAWRGSQQEWHPHLFYFLSNLDGAYQGFSSAYLDTYLEPIADVGSPYTIRPHQANQDEMRVNTSYGAVPNNITATTENRSVAYCNGCKSGADCGVGDCYSHSGRWFSANYYLAPSVTIPKNEWVRIEAYYKMNTITGGVANADGIMKLWVNGVIANNYDNVVYRTGYSTNATQTWNKIGIAPYIGDGSPITQTMWMDELVITDVEPYTTSVPVLTGVTITGGTVQ